ncbi:MULTISPECIES: DUF917 domain-containing protein [unclassified Sphingomonas]|uniref:DUF917 domain-containing protein n=1 Tax=unclassified Sphingomonas TaxID=196159 RepID=UPI0006F54562|nr:MULTISPECIES: DUF917 domain-containing protein [unclassified Sphingomonas]KQX23419.1 hypothetical protein ASD17_03710 [Sphingomonas sp. Root1294]KQY68270.1 hypothetical protein ASD39_06230 [Sphingomonas sp. Root50]KRB91169.1 hypothetical protein ASE22_13035 [Sphingomonas sp. Root720]
MKTLRREDIEDFALGGGLFGCGGGGDTYLGKLMLEIEMERCGEIPLLSVDEVPDDAMVVLTAVVGAPSVFLEKVPNGGEDRRVIEQVEKECGKPVFGILIGEVGGLNSILPAVTAARLGLPLIDADPTGRCVPSVHATAFNINHLDISPIVIADEFMNTVVIRTDDHLKGERLTRSMIVEMGGSAIFAFCPISGAQLRKIALPGAVTHPIAVGRAIREARASGKSPFEAVARLLTDTPLYGWADTLIEGKIVDVHRRSDTGFTIGRTVIRSLGGGQDELELEFKNEHLVARINGEVRGTVPDLITVLDSETGEHIGTDRLRYGQRVTVMVARAPAMWRTERGLSLLGPRAYDIDCDYVPVEMLNDRSSKTIRSEEDQSAECEA